MLGKLPSTWIVNNDNYRSGLVVWRHGLSAPLRTENRDGSTLSLTAHRSLLPSLSAVPSTDLRSRVRSTCQCRFCEVLVSASRPCKRLSKTISALKIIIINNHTICQSQHFIITRVLVYYYIVTLLLVLHLTFL